MLHVLFYYCLFYVYTTVCSVYMYILLLSMLCKVFYFAWVAQDLVSWNLHCTGVVCRLLKILQKYMWERLFSIVSCGSLQIKHSLSSTHVIRRPAVFFQQWIHILHLPQKRGQSWTKGLSTLNGHLPNPDLNPNPLPEVVLIWIAQLRVAREDQKKAWHVRACQRSTISVLLWTTHCVPHICSSQEATWWLAGVQIWWGHHGSCVEVWPLEVNVLTWICSTQCSMDVIDAHWIGIGQFGYWTGLNQDSVWKGLYADTMRELHFHE